LDQPAVSRSAHPRGPQVEERRRVLSCECQFLIGSYIFPEDLRDPESSTCTADFSIPVETGRPPFLVNVIRESSFVKRQLYRHILRRSAHTEIRFTLHEERLILDVHDTAPVKEMPY
jgi:hypothetical protein